MATIATLVVKIVGDASDLVDSLGKTQGIAGKAVGGLSAIGGGLVVGALGAATAAVTTLGVTAWNSAETIDQAYDTIQTQTGATGQTLKMLQADFDTVFKNVPTDAGQAADVIAGLHQKLDLTGPVLDDASIKLLKMTKLLGGDAKNNAALFGRTMQDAGLPVDQAGVLLDKLFVASQKSGLGVDTLMQSLVQFGAPMRNMGFDLDTSIALFAKWSKEGVNAELVMGSLRIAATNFAKDSIPLNEGLEDAITKIKGAKDASEALTIAQGIFGARAAGDMAAAIREGRFDIDDMRAALLASDGAINKNAAATADWGEKWMLFTNKLTLSLSPIGDVLREVADGAMEMLNSFAEKPEVQTALADLATWIRDLSLTAKTWLPQVGNWFKLGWAWLLDHKEFIVAALAILTVAIVAWAITSAIAIAPLIIELLPVIGLLLLIAAVAAILYLAWTENWGGIQEKTASVWAWLEPRFQQLVTWLQTDVPDALNILATFSSGLFSDLAIVLEVWTTNTFLLFEAFWAAVHGDWKTAGQKLGTIMGNTFDLLDAITSGRLKSLKAIWDFGFDDILLLILNAKDWEEAGIKITELIKAGFEFGLDDLFGFIFNVLAELAKGIFDFLSGFITGLTSANDVQTIIDDVKKNSTTPDGGPGGSETTGNFSPFGPGLGGNPGLGGLGPGIKSRFDTNGSNTQPTIFNVNIDHHPTISAQNDRQLQAEIETAVVGILKKYKLNLAN